MPILLAPGIWAFRNVPDRAGAREGLLRRLLAQQLGCGETEIKIERLAGGKPVLARPRRDFWFGTACRDGVMVVALSDQGPVGVDMEPLAACVPALADGVAKALFSGTETAWLEALPAEVRAEGFGRLWTAKEAVLKAHGIGLAGGAALPDLGARLPEHPQLWCSAVAELDGAAYTVALYSAALDDALILTARADAVQARPPGLA